ncbi:MAG: hypothetical protein ACOCSK_00280 [Rhodothermales bacterium]
MSSELWAAEALETAADRWEAGQSFEDDADARSIMGTVESVYAMVGDDHAELGRVLVAIGTALAAWRSGKDPGKTTGYLRDIARAFRDHAELRNREEWEVHW